MHKLDRAAVAAPACLANYNYQTQIWDDLDSKCKRELRFALFQMQGIPGITSEDAGEYGLRCAYCEGVIWHEGHIEHFRRKNRRRPDGYPELTFDWNNLFLACGSRDHCGHYKDRKDAPAYEADELIKPDQHEPDDYLYFHSSGEVRPRHGLDPADANRAAETIRVFGLDDRALRGERAKTVKSYLQNFQEELDTIADWDKDLRLEYFLLEIEKARWQPYATTIKHFFLRSAG